MISFGALFSLRVESRLHVKDNSCLLRLDDNVPLIGPPRGGQIGADGDEQEGVGKSRSAGASAQQAAAGGGCGAADARELPAGEEIGRASCRERVEMGGGDGRAGGELRRARQRNGEGGVGVVRLV